MSLKDTAPTATKIMMIRHAEKPTSAPLQLGVTPDGVQDDHSLIVRGWQRAGALATLFAPSNGQFQNPALATPHAIFAASGETTAKSVRSRQTVGPLTTKLGSAANTNYAFGVGQEAQVAAAVLASKGVVLITWEHHNIPIIASLYPTSANNKTPMPPAWPDDRFDLVWVFDWDEAGAGYTFSQIPQALLASDVS